MRFPVISYKVKIARRLFSLSGVQKTMRRFIARQFRQLNAKYASLSSQEWKGSSSHAGELPIYTCWWQGEQAAPALVARCLKSMRDHAAGHRLIVITRENWREHAEVPNYIVDKLEHGSISLTHFSDILRMVLIAKTGGLWLDATVFVAGDIPETVFSSDLYTIRYSGSKRMVSAGRWTGYCMAAPAHSALHCYCRDVFFEYWQNYNRLPEYFFIDYTIDFANEHIPTIHKQLAQVEVNNQNVMLLDSSFNSPYDALLYESLFKEGGFYKLNWKREYTEEIQGKLTNYGYFLREVT